MTLDTTTLIIGGSSGMGLETARLLAEAGQHVTLVGSSADKLDEARSTVLGFGRFHGLTLGQVAEQEPTYIDWIASTITRDRDLVMRARVIASDLDARGVERRPRVAEA